jgi:hypothetical protein
MDQVPVRREEEREGWARGEGGGVGVRGGGGGKGGFLLSI